MNWKSVGDLLLLAIYFCIGFVVWVFFSFVAMETGAKYEDAITVLSGASIFLLWLARVLKVLKSK